MMMIGNAYLYTFPHSHVLGFELREPSSRFSHVVATIAHGGGIIKMTEVLMVDLGPLEAFAVH